MRDAGGRESEIGSEQSQHPASRLLNPFSVHMTTISVYTTFVQEQTAENLQFVPRWCCTALRLGVETLAKRISKAAFRLTSLVIFFRRRNAVDFASPSICNMRGRKDLQTRSEAKVGRFRLAKRALFLVSEAILLVDGPKRLTGSPT
jgi:hypothetical protein